jgi:hypothetical protein
MRIVLEPSAQAKPKENGTMKTIIKVITMVMFAVGLTESKTLWLKTITM